jgi:hypothetical protein
MNRRVLAEIVAYHQADRIALTNPQFPAGYSTVIGPHGGILVAVAGQVDGRRLRGEPIFLGLRFREAETKRAH